MIQGNAEDISVVKDASIDLYFSSLCLPLVEFPEKMLSEAYRVLKASGRAIFSVTGRREPSYLMTERLTILEEFGVKIPPKRDAFHLNDKEKTISLFEEAGFVNVIAWDQFNPFLHTTDTEVDELIGGGLFRDMFAMACPEKKDELTQVFADRMKAVLRDKKTPLGFDVMIILAERK